MSNSSDSKETSFTNSGNYSTIPNTVLYADEFPSTVIVLVGLPARGKTFISTKITRYLNWIGVKTRVFNVGEYRRYAMGENFTAHDFFRTDNETGLAIRHQAAIDAFNDMANWLQAGCSGGGGKIGVFDATNTTRERREWITKQCKSYAFSLFFVESVCSDQKIVEENVRVVKIRSPDYTKWDDKEKAVRDFMDRIRHYEDIYETLDVDIDNMLSFIKIFNQGQYYVVNHLKNNMQSRIVYYLMNCKVLNNQTIYLTRHGESEFNLLGRIGGDSNLSESGLRYAEALAKYINTETKNCILKVWTSHYKRTIQTARDIICSRKQPKKALNEIDAGVCEGMTYEEIEAAYPTDFAKRDVDKYHYRYPSGESYQDLVARLEPVIMELERQKTVLVVCHQAVARCLLAYFLDKRQDELPYLKVPLHTVLKLTPVAYGCIVENIKLDVPAVDTHRARPENVDVSRSSYDALATIPTHQ